MSSSFNPEDYGRTFEELCEAAKKPLLVSPFKQMLQNLGSMLFDIVRQLAALTLAITEAGSGEVRYKFYRLGVDFASVGATLIVTPQDADFIITQIVAVVSTGDETSPPDGGFSTNPADTTGNVFQVSTLFGLLAQPWIASWGGNGTFQKLPAGQSLYAIITNAATGGTALTCNVYVFGFTEPAS